MALSVRQNQVYQLLIAPIECSKSFPGISYKDGIIRSSQRYCYGVDPDMSDFAVGFYEVVYKSLLSGKRLLSGDGFFSDVEFAGDSMNSFNTVANIILGDADSKHRSPKSEWPAELLRFHDRFQSLANYWLIPMRFGRTGTKLNKYDSVDLFLDRLRQDFSQFQEQERILYRGFQSENYFRRFAGYEDFCTIHFVERSIEAPELLELYQSRSGCMALVCKMTENIESRARCIAKAEAISDSLWKWFRTKELIA